MITEEQRQHAHEVLLDIRRQCGYTEDGKLNSQFSLLRDMVEKTTSM